MNLLRTSVPMAPSKISATDLILSLRQRIEDVLTPLIPTGAGVALIDFPDHPNVGDSAIWLGEKACLRKLGTRIVYSCDIATYSHENLSKKIKDGIILISGGGNLGDLWPAHQDFRERVIADFPYNKIIQLPQSIYFKEKENLDRAKKIFNSHPNFTLLLRDNESFRFARQEFNNSSCLCPDMALMLGQLRLPTHAPNGIVYLLRTDQESLKMNSRKDFIKSRIDWLKDKKTLVYFITKMLSWLLSEYPRHFKILRGFLKQLNDFMAQERLARGIHELGRGSVVVTDRLHGHILSLLLGIPHVVMDNSYGKIKSFFETWTHDCDLVHWANSPIEVLKLGKSLSEKPSDLEKVNP